jgi:S-(hydroxymethyl)glutathione dehydrogenase/alcohol dehydrogenase
MRAVVMREPGQPLAIEEVEIAEPGPGEVLVRMAASGVCHSDLHVLLGEWEMGLPLVLGHEGAGVVEALGDGVQRVAVGDPVVLAWTPGCATCTYCVTGRPHICENLLQSAYQNVMLDGTPRIRKEGDAIYSFLAVGSFGEYAVVPETGAVPIAEGIPMDLAAVVGCAVATGFGAASNTVQVPVGASAVVIGLGGVGLSIVQGCVAQSAGLVVAVDVHDDKLELATRLGATHVLNATSTDPVVEVAALTGERGVDFTFEAIGLKATIEQAITMLGRNGTAVLVGMPPEGTRFEADPLTMTMFEQRVVGSNYGSCNAAIDFPRLLDLYQRGRVDLDALVTARIGLEDINDAFSAMSRGEGVRTVVVYE